jgi:hypothetical protein
MTEFAPKNKTNKFEDKYTRLEPVFDSFKKAFTYLAKEMKVLIDNGVYDVVVSDESGGRIPSLILWNIMRLANKDFVPELRFVPGDKHNKSEGKYMPDMNGKSVIIVTEFINEGDTIRKLANDARLRGAKSVDLCVTQDIDPSLDVDTVFSLPGELVDGNIVKFAERHSILSGITKAKSFTDSTLMTVEKFLTINPQYAGNFLVDDNFNFASHNFTEQDREVLKRNLIKTRQKIHKIAEEIYSEVWGK